jgi:hypothetical protein
MQPHRLRHQFSAERLSSLMVFSMTAFHKDRRTHALAIAILAALSIALFTTTPTNGDFWWYDSSRHAMDGVFLRDFFLEGGLLRPIRFASDYYRQYPAINIGFYPPFFYLSSVPFLALFGASHAVSQAVVSLYALAAGVFAYLLALRAMDGFSALAAAVGMLCLPEMALWSRQVQIDVPAIALLLATAWCLMRYLECGARRFLFATTICLGLAILTRAQAICAVPPVLYFLFLHRHNAGAPMRLRLLALLPLALLAMPSVAMVAYFSRINSSQVADMPGMPKLLSIENWTWYAQQLPDQLGWPALVFVIAGLVAALALAIRRRLPLPGAIAFGFCISSWFMFSLISNKEPRFNLPSLPFLFLLAAIGLAALLPRPSRVALPLLAAWLAWQSLAVAQVPVVAGFKEATLAAQQLTPRDANVLIAAHRDGNFIYDMRVYGKRRDIGIRRADKLLVNITISQAFGVQDRHYDTAKLEALLKKENIATIVVQEGYLSDQPSMQNLQALLDAGREYRRVQAIAMTGETRKDEKRLVVYARTGS